MIADYQMIACRRSCDSHYLGNSSMCAAWGEKSGARQRADLWQNIPELETANSQSGDHPGEAKPDEGGSFPHAGEGVETWAFAPASSPRLSTKAHVNF